MRSHEHFETTAGVRMSFVDDVRYAARSLARRPTLLAVTTITLGVGIAANVVMFGIVGGGQPRSIPPRP